MTKMTGRSWRWMTIASVLTLVITPRLLSAQTGRIQGHVADSVGRPLPGTILLIDGGCSAEGYKSDISRTFVLGKATEKMNRVFEIVHRAQGAALAAARPGVACESVDRAARKVIEEARPDFVDAAHARITQI